MPTVPPRQTMSLSGSDPKLAKRDGDHGRHVKLVNTASDLAGALQKQTKAVNTFQLVSTTQTVLLKRMANTIKAQQQQLAAHARLEGESEKAINALRAQLKLAIKASRRDEDEDEEEMFVNAEEDAGSVEDRAKHLTTSAMSKRALCKNSLAAAQTAVLDMQALQNASKDGYQSPLGLLSEDYQAAIKNDHAALLEKDTEATREHYRQLSEATQGQVPEASTHRQPARPISDPGVSRFGSSSRPQAVSDWVDEPDEDM